MTTAGGSLRLPKAGYRLFQSRSWSVLSEGVWHNNPIFGMVLGLCSTLAVTNLMANALVMAIAVTVVLVVNSVIIAVMREAIPARVRMIVYMFIISTLVITVDMTLRILVPDISQALGPYVALIITNCIIMGRAEAFAANNTPGLSAVDALGVGLGYSFALLAIGLFRELLGFGSLFGVRVLPDAVTPAGILAIPPGAFFALGLFILLINTLRGGPGGRQEEETT